MLANQSLENSIGTADLESHFLQFRRGIIGIDQKIKTPLHSAIPMVYADWTASGRCYQPIEDRLVNGFMPFIANTHTETNASSAYTTRAYQNARQLIKRHVNAGEQDILISAGSGMTDVVNKLQRILGLRVPEQLRQYIKLPEQEKPVVFITHMEHHSNHTSWLETICDVVVVPPGKDGSVSLQHFEHAVGLYRERRVKIAAITACSNVTGITTPYHEIAMLIHKCGGYCFVDFACSAPYVMIDMHPDDPEARLDAVYFSPHKFLGGPGASGILVFNASLYNNTIPDVSGGGTVDWTNPWGGRKYVSNIEEKEDGGTPAILQTIKAALAIELKETMGVRNIMAREQELMQVLWDNLSHVNGIEMLAKAHTDRLGIISLCVQGMHHNDVVRQLNDKYGIQTRGGCSCAGTYGHYLLGVDKKRSKEITDMIDQGDHSEKPGWVRISIHPTMTEQEMVFIASSLSEVVCGNF